MSPRHLNSNGNGSATFSHPENGNSDLDMISSEKAVQELLQHPVQGLDEHLIEFSEAMRTVAKALRRVSEGKASAQAEAAEWKRKFELERAKNFTLERKELSIKDTNDELRGEREAYLKHKSDMVAEGSIGNEKCCGKNGICNHEVLKDGELDSKPSLLNGKNKTLRKASFKLAWDCEDENSNQYKHDVVSFARGDIKTTQRSSKQISLKWETSPQTVLVLTKPNSVSVQILCAEMIRWLTQTKKLRIFVEPRVRSELLEESAYFDFVQTWKDGDEEEISLLHKKVDLVVTLGGDGTVLWDQSL